MISAEIYRRTDGTYGYTVKDSGMAVMQLSVAPPGHIGHDPKSFDTQAACEQAATDAMVQERARQSELTAFRLDRAKWVTVNSLSQPA